MKLSSTTLLKTLLVQANAYYWSYHKKGSIPIYVNSMFNVQPVNLDEFCSEINLELTDVLILTDRSLLVLSLLFTKRHLGKII